MALVLLLGGARSGKSGLAVELARRAGEPVTMLATGQALDAEMAERIALHRAERPAGWTTVEEPVHLRRALAAVPAGATALVDCLSLWVANLLEAGQAPELIEAEAAAVAALAARRSAMTVAVSNEVGLGVVPATPLGRSFRDLLGRVNATWAQAAEHSALVVAGRALRLEEGEALLREVLDG